MKLDNWTLELNPLIWLMPFKEFMTIQGSGQLSIMVAKAEPSNRLRAISGHRISPIIPSINL